MKIIECQQGSEEWHQARIGCVTASMFGETRKRLKSGPNKGDFTNDARNYAFRLAVERIGGQRLDGDQFDTWAMKRGRELEPIARMEHEARTGLIVQPAGFVMTEDGSFGASADGLIDDDGGAEYKCLVSPEKLRQVYLSRDLSDFTDQVQGGMWITGRKWWHFVVYCPAMAPIERDVEIWTIERDDNYIEAMEVDLLAFNDLVESFRQQLTASKLKRAA